MKILIPIFLIVVFMASCSSPPAKLVVTHQPLITASATLETRYQPRFEITECWYETLVGETTTCGYVRVPANRNLLFSNENSIQLAVLIIRSTSLSPAPDPVFFLSGGPGERAVIPTSTHDYWDRFDFVLKNRDMVFLDQRGTGFSTPSLNCPEADPQSCWNRLIQKGINLANYTSAASAADVNDVRLALGYEQINLLGGSYGTRLGLTILRDYPQGIRSAVLDSVSPPLIHLDTAMLENFVRALDVLFADCAADSACSTAYPELEKTLYSLSGQLENDPWNVPLPGGGTLNLTTERFLGILWESMNHTEALPYLPLLIHSTSQRDFAGLAALGSLSDDAPPIAGDGMSEGLLWSIHCAEEWAFEPEHEWQTAASALDPSIREPVMSNFMGFNDPCLVWDVPPASTEEEAAVYSSVPTLLLSGEYDPATSPKWAEMAAENLSQVYIYVLPGTGHVTFRTSLCSRSLIFTFLNDPFHKPNDSCIEEMGPPVFVTEP